MTELPRLSDALPTLSAALRPSLRREGEAALAAQVDELRVHFTCACSDPECLSVYLEPRRPSPHADYRVVLPDAAITIGVRAERIVSIEDYSWCGDDGEVRAREYRALVGTVPTREP